MQNNGIIKNILNNHIDVSLTMPNDYFEVLGVHNAIEEILGAQKWTIGTPV